MDKRDFGRTDILTTATFYTIENTPILSFFVAVEIHKFHKLSGNKSHRAVVDTASAADAGMLPFRRRGFPSQKA
jgi:hypothetical protein